MKGFKFDGTHSDELFLITNGKKVPFLPSVKDNYENIAGKDGVWDYGVQYGTRSIEIDCTIIATSAQDLKDKVRNLVGHFNPRKGAKPLIFDDDPNIQYMARLEARLPLEQIGALGTFTLQLVCTDPFAYSINETVNSGVGTIWATHNGTYEARPILTITHGGGTATITNERSDGLTETMTFTSDAPSGTYIVDTKQETVKLGTDGADKYLQGDIFKLPSGSNKILTDGSISNVEVRFRDTWL